MYYTIVVALMFVFPLASIVIEASLFPQAGLVMLTVKWFGFWAVGIRLMLAGLRQIFQPAYTANAILGLKADASLILVRELGFANLAIGIIAVAGLWLPTWRLPAAAAGAVFYLLAGINHLRQPHRNRMENAAMISDLFVGVLLGVTCLFVLVA